MPLKRPNMPPKAPLKHESSALHEIDSGRDRDEFSDGCLSQDEESEERQVRGKYGKPSTGSKTSQPAPKTSSTSKSNKIIPYQSSPSTPRQIRISSSTKDVVNQEVMTDPVYFNQSGVFTQVFIIQLIILIGILLVFSVWFTYYIRDMQERDLKENMDRILYVSKSGQRYVDKTINDKMSIRIPVLLSNGTPTVIDNKVDDWLDSYFKKNVPNTIEARVQQQHRHKVEQFCSNKVKELVDEKITTETINEEVIDKLIPYINESIEKNSPQLIENQMEVLLADSIKEKLRSYIDELIKLESNGAFKSITKEQDMKSLFIEILNVIIREYVKINTPEIIDKYTSSEAAIKDMNDKLKMMIDKRLTDAPVVIDKALVDEKLLHQINLHAEHLLKQELKDQIDSSVKNDVEEVVKHYGNQAENLQKEVDKKRDELTEKITQAEHRMKDLMNNFSELGKPGENFLSRQDRHGNLITILTLLVVVLMFCMYWIYYRQGTDGSSNQHMAVAHQENLRLSGTCIILFNGRLREEIKKLVTDLKIPDFDYEFYVIKCDDDIASLPKHKVYLMCCEFTERHVIIEEKGLGLGDLHRNTYDKVMKISGKLVILYIHDPGSRQLKDGNYNKDIYCVTSQPELSKLNDHECFFSIHKQLTDFQVKKLGKKLTEYLK